MKPFLKWAGNKYKIVERIKALLPSGQRLVEPFVGSGALFLNTDYPRYLLTDANEDLINLYQHLQTEGEAFIAYCRPLFSPENNDEEKYYAFRTKFNATKNLREKSALFIYLNRHCYNGLCRYNSKGIFNVPFGRYKKPYFPEKEMLFFYQKAQSAEFLHLDFHQVMENCNQDDVVYCDPPYAPLSETANFTAYHKLDFGILQQKQLAEQANLLAAKGITVVISNHDTDFVRAIYSTADLQPLTVQRFISCNGSKRKKANEILALFSG